MIWHIFRKDCRLLWRMSVLVASVHFLFEAVLYKLGHFGDETLASLMNLIFVIAFLGSGFLIAAVVHLDAIPGVSQDWLVRPVRRRDLLLAKLLFIVVAVETPILIADLMQCLANGFPLGQSLAACVSRSVYLLVGFGLPVLVLASLTKNVMETMVGGVAALFGVAMFIVVAGRGPRFNVNLLTGAAWVAESARFAAALLGAIAILGLLYFRRKTAPAMWLAGSVTLLCLLTGFIPWQLAFAIQQQRAPSPGAGRSVEIAFEPMPGKAQRIGEGGSARGSRFADAVLVYLPLRISGLPDDAALNADRSEVRLIGADGQAEDLGAAAKLVIRNEGGTQQAIRVGGGLYSRFKNQPVRLEIDYSLTLFGLAASHAIPAMSGSQRTPELGWCMTEVNESRTYVRLNCLKPGKLPGYATASLEHNPELTFGHPNYSPYFGQYLCDAISRFGVDLPFGDPSGLAGSQIMVRTYEPRDHFTRRLVIPGVRLQNFY